MFPKQTWVQHNGPSFIRTSNGLILTIKYTLYKTLSPNNYIVNWQHINMFIIVFDKIPRQDNLTTTMTQFSYT